MLPTLIAIPILLIALILQTVVMTTLSLLSGTADLLLLVLVAWGLQERVRAAWQWAVIAGGMAAVITGLPWYVPFGGYLGVMLVARMVRRRVWQSPILAMALVTLVSSLLYQGMTMVVLIVRGVPLNLADSINLVILPATLINLMLALPVQILMVDLARWLYPEEVDL